MDDMSGRREFVVSVADDTSVQTADDVASAVMGWHGEYGQRVWARPVDSDEWARPLSPDETPEGEARIARAIGRIEEIFTGWPDDEEPVAVPPRGGVRRYLPGRWLR